MALFKATTFTHLHTHLEHPQAQYQVDPSTTAQEQLPASGDRTMQENRETRERGGNSGTQHRAHSFLSSPSSISLGASTRRVYNLSVAVMEVVDYICFVTASPLGCYQG